MKKLRVGVIGIGDISNVYLNNLKKYDAVEVVACASRGLEKAQRKAAEHGIPKAYASGMELIADPDIDLVLNLTTPQAHYEYNLAALKAGKHVYTEKPLAMTFAEGKELVELAKEKGLLIGCAPDTFLGGRLQNIRELIDSGRLDEKIIAIPFSDPTYNTYHEIFELPQHVMDEMAHFFTVYKSLENKDTIIDEIRDAKAAKEIIQRALDSYVDNFCR